MTLSEVVKQYLDITARNGGGYGHAVPLADFNLDRAQIENIFGAFDEDYHISRYLHLTHNSGVAYKINGFDHTHISIDAEIQSIL